jgi:hypothetical protein
VRAAIDAGKVKGQQTLKAQMVLTVGDVGLTHKVDGTIEIG